MRIGILGAGNMADALGTPWARAGHEVLVGGRDAGRAAALAARMGSGVRSGTLAEAAAFGETVLIAVHAEAAVEVLAAVGAGEGALRGRTLIDCTNAVVPGSFLLAAPMAERVAAAAPGAHVVKAFNLCHVDVWRLTPPVFDGVPLGVPLCGDDPGALADVTALIRDLGCAPLPGGGLARAGLLEATAAFLIGLWLGEGADARSAVPPLSHSRD
ncbi:NADPH-dependent F420 reductase [Streptomyces litchfieldiae]|uniref:NAD(P)-binding domain-containing protein n=1 Tax=Streptomyces litchfieldiae TaxID=3075543 RepID=A0ABU2MJP7_9ACTN|nr:NAD(P)-binding domain-containing protein [Streptomyces sp. DSM 44938]MDT0341715.1 NAD(P)-binding domain-containing protein [Streptomyces sp. DSM 44938]